MPTAPSDPPLSRRERQIMDAIYARGSATAAEVADAIEDAPTPTTVRTLMGILVEKGHLRHAKAGRAFVYSPVRPRRRVARSALRRLLATFFEGSIENAVAAHFADPAARPTPEEIARLEAILRDARREAEKHSP